MEAKAIKYSHLLKENSKFSASTDEEDAYETDEEEEDHNNEEDAYESAKDEQNEIFHMNDSDLSPSRKSRLQGRCSKNSLAKEIKKIKNSFPIWNTREIGWYFINKVIYKIIPFCI